MAARADVSAFTDVLAGRELAHRAYAVLFGYVIDGLVWDALRSAGLLPEGELSVERPYWNGAFWAVYPPRDGAMGTNEVKEPGAGVTMVWTDPTVRALNRLAGSPALRPALRAAGRDEALVAGSGYSWTFVGDGGRPMIPIIRRQESDPVHAIGLRIAAKVVSALLRDVPGSGVVVAAHELIWSLMDALEAAGIVRRPAVFGDARATPDALGAQMFLVAG